MADELEKLREKVEKDPNSKLFVSLAEMYRKAGRLDEAMSVLQGGIARQPAYTTARVALGKIYIEKELKKEAKEEFEAVVAAIPDNLYAQKKLAEIYMEEGHRDNAKKALRVVIRLNPMDEEAASFLKELDKKDQGLRTEDLLQTTSLAEVPEMDGTPIIEIPETERTGADPVNVNNVNNEEESTLEGETVAIEEEKETEASKESPVEEVLAVEGEAEASYMELNGRSLAEADIPADLLAPAELPEEEAIAPVEPLSAEPVAGQKQQPTASLNLGGASPAPTFPFPGQKQQPTAPSPAFSIETADLLVAKGDYARAIGVLSRVLAHSPGDRVAMGRMAELKMLVKMLGKGKEVRTARLEGFLGGVRKKRDEFFGNP